MCDSDFSSVVFSSDWLNPHLPVIHSSQHVFNNDIFAQFSRQLLQGNDFE